MIQPALGIYPYAGDECTDFFGQRDGAGRGVLDFIHGRGEAIKVVDGFRALRRCHGGLMGQPMGGDGKNGFRAR